MISCLSDIITDFYIEKNIIKSEHKAVYKLGLELILNDIITFFIIILMSAFIFDIRYSFEFLIVFCSVRIYCGGYHASKAYICRLTMLAVFILVVTVSGFLENTDSLILYSLLLISFAIVAIIAPVKHPNKTLSEESVRKGKRKAVFLHIVYALCSAISYEYINNYDGMIICLSLCAVSALGIIGKIIYEGR